MSPTLQRTRSAHDLGIPRWDGRKGRLEVWYATFTGTDGSGYWVHHETVAPTGEKAPYAHGWAAVFPVEGSPTVARFGPVPACEPAKDRWFDAAAVTASAGRMSGTAGALRWDLAVTDTQGALYTFPEAVWQRELLPGAQIVPSPRAEFRGTFTVGGEVHEVDAVGARARIYGHGNAQRWCWLHADLGEGAGLEIVSATPRRPGLRHVPAVPMLQLRIPGEPDWPTRPLLCGPLMRARIARSGFTVRGRIGHRRIRVDVSLPRDRCVVLGYTDPDGATATCTNSERADVTVIVERRDRGWPTEHRWELRGTGHAEIGTRP